MKKHQSLFLLLLVLLCADFHSLFALKRDCSDRSFCPKHLKEGATFCSDYDVSFTNRMLPYIYLFPTEYHNRGYCSYFDCPCCDNKDRYIGYFEYYDYHFDEWSWDDDAVCSCVFQNLREGNDPYSHSPDWIECNEKSCIFGGYFSSSMQKNFCALERFLNYSNNASSSCRCYWPEVSNDAAKLSDKAYDLFKGLFKETSLSNTCLMKVYDCDGDFCWNYSDVVEEYHDRLFERDDNRWMTLRGASCFCIAHSFLFSDYLRICQNILFFSEGIYTSCQYEQIEEKVN